MQCTAYFMHVQYELKNSLAQIVTAVAQSVEEHF